MRHPIHAHALAFPATTLAIVGSDAGFQVRRVYCVGRNYLDHIREMKEGDERDPPFFFQKPTDAVVVEGRPVPYPPHTSDFQHEVELVVAIGRQAVDVSEAEALDCIYGYAIGIDMTRRDRQREARDLRLPWEVGKSFDHSAPCGPIHPASNVGHLKAGRVTLTVNGAQRQSGDLGEMIWSTTEIVANLSSQYALAPGDLIFTGTPAGVGPVLPGDVMVGAIDRLGSVSFLVSHSEH